MGHARALLGLPDETAQLRLGREVVSKQLSVRETEVLVKKELDFAFDTRDDSEGCPHARRRGAAPLRAGHRRPDRSKAQGRKNRGRLHLEEELQRLYEQIVTEST